MKEAFNAFEGGVKFDGFQIKNLSYSEGTILICNSRVGLMDLLESKGQARKRVFCILQRSLWDGVL